MKIAEEVSDFYSGSFFVKNIGGGLLTGTIITDNDVISFDETDFEGNEYELKYNIDVREYEPNKLLKFNVYIVSNGGEIIIPVFIKVLKNIFYTDDGYKITDIKSFFSYFKKKPLNAIDIFYSEEFFKWLAKINFQRIDMLKLFLNDEDKERAIDNFFLFCKLKKKSYVEAIEKNINIFVKPFQKEKIFGSIALLKKGYGYIHKKIDFKYNNTCIKFEKNELTSKDFDIENRCYINYEIAPCLITSSFSKECVIIDENTFIKINISVLPKIVVNLSQEIYEYDDFGSIIIENNCGKDLVFELSAKDNFIEFESRHYIVSDKDKVNFKIKRSKMKSFIDKMTFNKKLYTESEIYVKTVFNNQTIKKTRKIVLGNSLF